MPHADRNAIWMVAALLLVATGPVYPLLIRGWSEWTTDLSQVQAARRIVWAGLYVVMLALLWRWRSALPAALAPHAFLPLAGAWFLASSLWSPEPADSVLALAQFALTLAFGGAAAVRLGPLGVLRAVRLVGILATALSVAMIAASPLHAFGQHVNAGALRGVYVEKNHLAAVLSYAFAAAAFEIAATPPGRRAGIVAGAAAMLAALLAARSSIALAQAALALGLAASFVGLRGARYGAAVAGCALLAALAALAVTLPATLAAMGEDPTLNGRTELWAMLAPHVEARPLVGHGFFGFWSRPEAEEVRDVLGWNARGAHNGWLTALLTGGIAGAALWAAHWAGIARAAWAALAPGGEPARAGCAALVVAHLVWSLFESNQLTHLNHNAMIAGIALALPVWAGADARRPLRAPGAG